jgi:hypothetical protein
LYLPVAAKYEHLPVVRYLLTLVQHITYNTINLIYDTLQILVKCNKYDDDIIQILQNGGMWWGAHGEGIVRRCWKYATYICNDSLRETLRVTFPAFFPKVEETYHAMTMQVAIETRDVNIASHYWELSQLPTNLKQNIGRVLYLYLVMNKIPEENDVVQFFINKLK